MFEILTLPPAQVKQVEVSSLVPVVVLADPGLDDDSWIWTDAHADAMAEEAEQNALVETFIRF